MSPQSIKSESLIVRGLSCLIVVGLTAAYLSFHAESHTADNLSSAAQHLLQGRTHWITFQNRLLAPFIVSGISMVTGLSWLQSFQVLIALCLGGGAGFLLWRSWKTTGNSPLGLLQVGGWFSLAFLFNHTWSYPWDYTGALLFLLVMVWAKDCFHALVDLKSWRLGVLLVLMVLNRESSLIVIAGLILATLAGGLYEKTWLKSFRIVTVLSLSGLTNIIGVVYVRHALFMTPTRPAGAEGPETSAGNFNQIAANLNYLTQVHNWNQFWGTTIVALLFVVSSVLTWATLRDLFRSTPVALGDLLIRSCLWASTVAIVVFADTSEIRVYFELIPIAILLAFQSPSLLQKSN